jgi:ectoine hydroxylase-related dioxygenase (phytanoyl-CoA dioxygenase family)
MNRRLTAVERDCYASDGFLVREQVFSPTEVAAIRAATERLCEALVARTDRSGQKVQVSDYSVFEKCVAAGVIVKWEPSDQDRLKGVEPCAHLDPYLTALADHPGLVEPMRDLLDCDDVALFTEKLNLKRAHGGAGFGAHRDHPYWKGPAEEPHALVTAFVALDDAEADNGPLEVLPGSHRLADVPQRASERVFESFEIDETRLDTAAMHTVPLRAGDVVFFGPFLVHRSAANLSARDRRALLYTYQRAGLRTQLDNVRGWTASAAGDASGPRTAG